MESTDIRNLQEENTAWMTKVLFYEKEMKVMENSLQETVGQNSPEEKTACMEKLRNWFLNLALQIKNLKCSIMELAKRIAADHCSIQDHRSLKENMIRFESSFLKLRIEFNSFTGKQMNTRI